MEATLPGLLIKQAAEHGDKVFLQNREQQISYQEAEQRTQKIAAFLQSSCHVKTKDNVALLLGNELDYLVLFIGIQRAGAVAVTINNLLKEDEITFQLDHVEASVLITSSKLFKVIEPALPKLGHIKHIILTDADAESSHSSYMQDVLSTMAEPADLEIMPQDIAAMLFTSGTTGRPKAVMLIHQNYISSVEMLSKRFSDIMSPDFASLFVMPLFHISGQYMMTVALYAGGKLVIDDGFNPKYFIQMLEDTGCQSFSAVPTMLAYLNKMKEYQGGHLIEKASYAFVGSAPLAFELLDSFEKKFGLEIIEGYGLTESTNGTINNPPHATRKGSIGKPLDGVLAKICDAEGKEVATGETGEIILQGPNIMKGYYNNQKATEETKKDDWLHTGDVGHIDADGYFYITGRKKDMIIRGGENIYPKEIEELIYKLPQVSECCILGIPDDVYGEQVLAAIHLKDGENLLEKEVKSFLNQNLARYKVPAYIVFVDDFPRTASGKIQKPELKEQLLPELKK
jgi:long-chain acyl-CoA synthetase